MTQLGEDDEGERGKRKVCMSNDKKMTIATWREEMKKGKENVRVVKCKSEEMPKRMFVYVCVCVCIWKQCTRSNLVGRRHCWMNALCTFLLVHGPNWANFLFVTRTRFKRLKQKRWSGPSYSISPKRLLFTNGADCNEFKRKGKGGRKEWGSERGVKCQGNVRIG